ncbi:MAG: Ig-like domain-containing protein [Verrucomicrobiota bacterium]
MRLTLFSIVGIMLGMSASGALAATALGVREATPEGSSASQVPVTLTTDAAAVALQADVLFDEDLYTVSDATGGTQPEGVKVESRKIGEGTLRVVVYHRSNGTLGNDVVFQVPLTAKAGVVDPDPVVLANFHVSSQGGSKLTPTLLPKVRLVGLRGSGMNGRQGIELSVIASATEGNVTKVEYYVGGLKIGESMNSTGRFAHLWSPPTSGPFEVLAIAFDSNGQQVSSRTIPIIVTHVGTYNSPVLGNYFGLVRGPTFSFANDGYVTMTSAVTKAFTLKLLIGGKTWPASGKFDDNGNASVTIKRGTGIPNLTVILAHSSAPSVDQIHGRVADGTFANGKFTGNTFETEFTVNRVTWKLKTNEAPQNGAYTMLIPAHVDASTQKAPLGTGFGTVTVGKDGSAKLVGSLADGSPGITASSYVSKNGFWPVYASLYTNKGVIMGDLAFGDIEETSDVNGSLTWMRPADSKAAMFKLGFGTTVQGIGSRFVKPAVNARLFPLANVGGNSLLFLTGGGLPEDLERLTLMTAANKGIIPIQGADATTFVPVPTTGLVSGAFLHQDTQKSVAYKGAVLQKQNLAGGFFVGGTLGGDVGFNANPDLPPGTGDAGPIGTTPLPIVKITAPVVNSTLKSVTANTVQIKGTASDKQGIASVKIQVLHNGVLTTAMNAVGTVSWTYDLTVPNGEGGLYTIYAKATDSSPAADESEVLSHAFWVPLKSALVIAVNDATKGSVTTGYLGSTQRDVGKNVSVTATPKTKKKFVRWTETATGDSFSTSPKITVLMEVGLSLTANFSD